MEDRYSEYVIVYKTSCFQNAFLQKLYNVAKLLQQVMYKILSLCRDGMKWHFSLMFQVMETNLLCVNFKFCDYGKIRYVFAR